MHTAARAAAAAGTLNHSHPHLACFQCYGQAPTPTA